MNVETAKLTYFDFDGENMTGPFCLDYGILDDTRFVIVCETGQNNSYQLRLYNLSNFKLLDIYSVNA